MNSRSVRSAADWRKMRCPTCGKQVAGKQDICSFCGAMVRTDTPAFEEGGPGFGGAAKSFEDGQTTAPSAEFSNPETIFESGEAPAQDATIPRNLAPPPTNQPPATPRAAAPSIIRIILVLAFFVIPLINSLVRNFTSSTSTTSAPVVREVIFCEDVRQGLPVNPKTVFSLGRDRQVVLYSRWTGSRGNHAVLLRWYIPQVQGTPLLSPIAQMRYEEGRGGFSASGFLPLQPGMPLGTWKVEVLLDGQVRAGTNFQLRE